ncbi:hypothetical protein WH52_01360 [Tenacibaculum holothuriorum]|uniref:Uncharacterized protein n=2 Tax=Tenacibaculum holothuriorum TaxID=1635173 RepID=A0A1Y2PFV7_9FLAO|nr:hypothetical protein WH52_01360 [Tenacibaculum holothuriorum]
MGNPNQLGGGPAPIDIGGLNIPNLGTDLGDSLLNIANTVIPGAGLIGGIVKLFEGSSFPPKEAQPWANDMFNNLLVHNGLNTGNAKDLADYQRKVNAFLVDVDGWILERTTYTDRVPETLKGLNMASQFLKQLRNNFVQGLYAKFNVKTSKKTFLQELPFTSTGKQFRINAIQVSLTAKGNSANHTYVPTNTIVPTDTSSDDKPNNNDEDKFNPLHLLWLIPAGIVVWGVNALYKKFKKKK